MLRFLSVILMLNLPLAALAARTAADEPLLDWSMCQRYRQTVVHPATVIKPADLQRARENQTRYEWARQYVKQIEASAQADLQQMTPDWIAKFIPTDTPGDTLFTPCPACRDQQKPENLHGLYRWSASNPEVITCQTCGTTFPNDKYPESIVFKTKYGGGQTLSFYGGPAFNLFGFLARPSFTAKIRAHKVATASTVCARLAEAYALTGKVEYAQATRLLLLRFAQVYPNWLVHVGYGEYADMDPHVAALNIDNLPADEITPTPGGPDRKLHSGYWQGGRATGTGMEAGFVRQMTEAYSFVCQAKDGAKPVFTEDERLKIERDLLLESTVLLVADKEVNNKSVGNATAVALVGMVVGHPEMVRFGLDVFLKTVDGWFLPDGGTSESFSYAAMTLSGIEALGQAFRGYSDPPGYTDADGKRIDKIDLYHDTAYKRVWEAMFHGLQGDLLYPPLADSHRTQALGSHFVELMADNYPENPQYVALLKELAGQNLQGGDLRTAIYCRPPDLAEKPTPPLTLPDYVYPVLRLGYLRGGETGRNSALIMSASDWGGHHHVDSLSLYYWQNGKELLSDLGYLWDHPKSIMSRRTFAHNTVMVDGTEQASLGREGEFTLFSSQGAIKVMEAESKAYPQASLYRRTVAQIEHAPGRQYVLDLFRVQGGTKHEYVFHGINNLMQVATAPQLAPFAADTKPFRFAVRLGIDTPGTEMQLDDVSITAPDGREIAVNPSATELDTKTKMPVGYGIYLGDGTKESGQGHPGRTDENCVYLKALKAGPQMMNAALMIGDTDGYQGVKALEGRIGETYTVSFWVKGTAKAIKPSVLYWLADPASADNRLYAGIDGLSTISANAEWTQYSGKFTIRNSTLDLTNIKASDAVAPWRLTWPIQNGTEFAALWPNEAGYTSIIGDGWGQRDYRNADVGALLPYIVRQRSAGTQPTVYVTAFEGYAPGEALVRSVQQLPVPATEAAQAVAVVVETASGRDYIVSCLTATPLTIATPDGPLTVNARFAAITIENGKITAASMAEGTSLQLNGKALIGQ